MKYVNLGRTGLRVSRICLGMEMGRLEEPYRRHPVLGHI